MGSRTCLFIAGLLAATGVAMGAYRAHGLEKLLIGQELTPSDISHRMDQFSSAVRFQMIHALAFMVLAVIQYLQPQGIVWKIVACGFLLGVTCFCGSLYGLSLADKKQLAHVAPVGGISLMISWAILALNAIRFRDLETE